MGKTTYYHDEDNDNDDVIDEQGTAWFAVRGNTDDLAAAINALNLYKGKTLKINGVWYVRGLRPGLPINNQIRRV